MSNIIPIDTKSIVKNITRPNEANKNVSAWFKEETLEINFGETVGRPDSDITLKSEYLVRFLENGWVIDAVVEKSDSGSWVNVGGTRTTSKSAVLSAHEVTGNYYMSTDPELADVAPSTAGGAREIVRQSTDETVRGLDAPVNASITESTPMAEAPAYWAAYQKLRLKRRRIVAELVMQSMIDSFTGAYNNGRGLEDARYNEVVSLYTLMLKRTESEGEEIARGSIDVTPLLNTIKERFLAMSNEANTVSTIAIQNIVKDAIADINREFDAKIAAEKAREISIGLYSTTIWPTVEAGYERQRAAAIVKAQADGGSKSVEIAKSSANIQATVGVNLARAAQEISKSIDERKQSVTELRNTVVKWMVDYIGGRKESYPELEETATFTQQVGFSNIASSSGVL